MSATWLLGPPDLITLLYAIVVGIGMAAIVLWALRSALADEP